MRLNFLALVSILFCSTQSFAVGVEGALVDVGTAMFEDVGASILLDHALDDKHALGLSLMRLGGMSSEPEDFQTRSQYIGISGRHYFNSYKSNSSFVGAITGYGERRFRVGGNSHTSYGLFLAPEGGYRWVFEDKLTLGAAAQFIFSNLDKDYRYSTPSSSGHTSAPMELNLKLSIGFIF